MGSGVQIMDVSKILSELREEREEIEQEIHLLEGNSRSSTTTETAKPETVIEIRRTHRPDEEKAE